MLYLAEIVAGAQYKRLEVQAAPPGSGDAIFNSLACRCPLGARGLPVATQQPPNALCLHNHFDGGKAAGGRLQQAEQAMVASTAKGRQPPPHLLAEVGVKAGHVHVLARAPRCSCCTRPSVYSSPTGHCDSWHGLPERMQQLRCVQTLGCRSGVG